MIAFALSFALLAGAQDPAPAPEPAPPNYAQSAFCEAVGRRLLALVEGAERRNGPSPESQALAGQAGLLVERAVPARAAARSAEGLGDADLAEIDAYVDQALDAAEPSQFENGVMNCFSLFGVE